MPKIYSTRQWRGSRLNTACEMQRLAWLGGSFNPVHFGHLRMATMLVHQFALDHLYFLPSARNIGKETLASHHRLAMLKLALQSLEQTHAKRLSIDCRELDRSGITYTIDTLRELRKEYPKAQINFILGEDSLANIEKWKDYKQLIEYAHLLVLQRQIKPQPCTNQSWVRRHTVTRKDWQQSTHGGIQFCPTGMIDCSSTMIRQAISQGKEVTSLIPQEVKKYIYQEKLYQK